MFLNKLEISKSAKKLWALFLDIIFPIECLGCGREGAWLCFDCFKKIKNKEKQYCLHCKKENKFGEFCLDCRSFYSLDGAWIAGNYKNELVVNLVKSLKYKFIRELSAALGKFMALFLRDLINRDRLTSNDLQNGKIWRKLDEIKYSPKIFLNFSESLIVPVPLHKKRLRWRGFNQSDAIARELVKYFDVEINLGDLARIKYKKPQVEFGEKARRENIKNCFTWRGGNFGGRNIILIDDVATTGSTLNECARVLKENGAGEVWGLVAAKG